MAYHLGRILHLDFGLEAPAVAARERMAHRSEVAVATATDADLGACHAPALIGYYHSSCRVIDN
jgi:hypothetical protein